MKTIEQLTTGSTAWYSSNDEEIWTGGPYATRDEAEIEAQANGHRLICEAGKTPVRVSKHFDAEYFLERADEDLDDYKGEDGDPILDFTKEAEVDLQKRVREAIDAWQVAHQLSPTPWMFDFSDAEAAAWTKAPADSTS